MTYAMKVVYEQLGGHTHISIWTGKRGFTLGKAGEICMTNEEFTAWRNKQILVEFKEKQPTGNAAIPNALEEARALVARWRDWQSLDGYSTDANIYRLCADALDALLPRLAELERKTTMSDIAQQQAIPQQAPTPRELVKRWREQVTEEGVVDASYMDGRNVAFERCADELELLLPELEAARRPVGLTEEQVFAHEPVAHFSDNPWISVHCSCGEKFTSKWTEKPEALDKQRTHRVERLNAALHASAPAKCLCVFQPDLHGDVLASRGCPIHEHDDAPPADSDRAKLERLIKAGKAMRDCNYVNTKNSMEWDAALAAFEASESERGKS